MTRTHPVSSIRLARPGDLDALAPIERSAASLFRDAGLSWLADGDTMDASILSKFCDQGTFWVAVDEGDKPVGFLAGQELDGLFHIAEVSVALSHQRQGIGAKLVGAAVAHAKALGLEAVTLTTYRDLAWNGPFYARLGFIEIDPAKAAPGHLERLRQEAEAGHDQARRCLMALRLDQPARSSLMAESRSNR